MINQLESIGELMNNLQGVGNGVFDLNLIKFNINLM